MTIKLKPKYMITQHGQYSTSKEYREHLLMLGYKDWGWQNGWNQSTNYAYRDLIKTSNNHEHIQWNRTGSDCLDVYHDLNIFSCTDMGD